MPVLYSFRRCPYAIRARMVLAKSAIPWEHREVNLKDKPEEMIRISAKGTVPVMVLDNGDVLDESLDIMLWALHRHDPGGWLKADMEQALALIHTNDHHFKTDLDHYKYHVRYPGHDQNYYRVEAETFLRRLEAQLRKYHGRGLLREYWTLADVAIFPFIRQFANVDRKWFDTSPYILLRAWLEGFQNSDEFQAIMHKYPFWRGSKPAE